MLPVLLAGVLVASAIGKLLSPARARAAFTTMGVPPWLRTDPIVTAHPWGELALAAGLVLASGWLLVLCAAASVALMVVYLVLIVRAARAPEPVDCACFGAIGADAVTPRTVWRNAWLLALALGTLAYALSGGSVRADLPGAWGWLAMVVAAVVTTVLVMSPGTAPGEAATGVDGDELDYQRTRIPSVPVTLADGTSTTLVALAQQRPQLLLQVSPTCVSCVNVVGSVAQWRTDLPAVDVRLLLLAEPDTSELTSVEEPLTVHDAERHVGTTFGMSHVPSAILLGADGWMAGGPVVGESAVREMVADIQAQLAGVDAPVRSME